MTLYFSIQFIVLLDVVVVIVDIEVGMDDGRKKGEMRDENFSCYFESFVFV
jgi:hypothetical protein